MIDNLTAAWRNFSQERRDHSDFSNMHRAVVVETNDPLNMQRIRVKCPDFHDFDMKVADCPWARACSTYGGGQAGNWQPPCIGDDVWIAFDRGHPYGLVWVGFADPTRVGSYPLPAVSTPTQAPITNTGTVGRPLGDFDKKFLPKDGRPMSLGVQSRYGSADIMSSVGFFPVTHNRQPPPPDFDPQTNTAFQAFTAAPEVNSPDVKHATRLTKYGHMFVLGDQGYWWYKSGQDGEFVGDEKLDKEFEIARWKYLQRLINEDKVNGDSRRILAMSRYGSRFEIRDTGWAQHGPIPSQSRPGEYGQPAYLSKETTADYRWIKIRTKGGMLFQSSDIGFHPADDEYIKRNLIDETGPLSEREDLHWQGKDARWTRIVTRHGIKFVLDDRGTDRVRAQSAAAEGQRCNGALIKGRRTGGSKANKTRTGSPTGFYWEFNENDDGNHTTWGTPLGQVVELNDATEYVAVCAGIGRDYAMPWRGLEENEFLRNPTRARNIERNTHHLVMDLQNEFIRLKTRSGAGPGPDDPSVNPPTAMGTNQGLEIRDGNRGDGPWTELVDGDGRGLWFTKKHGYGIWRGKAGSQLAIVQDDTNGKIIIYCGAQSGKIQLHCGGSVDVVCSDLNVNASGNIKFRAGGAITLQGNDGQLTVGAGGVTTPNEIKSLAHPAVPTITPITLPSKLEPSDRGTVYNTPSVVPDAEIEHSL